MSVTIQSATVDDAAAITGVQVSSLRATYGDLLPEHLAHLVLDPPDEQHRPRSWRLWLKRSQVSTLVARVDGTLTGFCTLQPMPDASASGATGEIAAIYVLPSHWRRGLGRRLCEQILAEAHSRGFLQVVLWVLESNDRARSFYESLGFRPDGQKRVFLERSATALHELRYRRATP